MGLLRESVKAAIDHLATGWMAQRYLRRIEAAPLVEKEISLLPRLCRAGRIRLEPVALSRSPGRAQLRMPVGNPSWATMAQTNQLEMAQAGQAIETDDAEVRTLDGELKPISSFGAAHDQDIHNVGLQGKVGRYINNFIYVPRERVGTLLNAYHPTQGVQ